MDGQQMDLISHEIIHSKYYHFKQAYQWMDNVVVSHRILRFEVLTAVKKHNRPLWVAVQGLIRPTPYTYTAVNINNTVFWEMAL
jgi:hypothetical protein